MKMAINLKNQLDNEVISNQEKHFMQNLQANILKGHGREHVALIFLKIEQVGAARTFLKKYPVTDAFTQLEETVKFKEMRIPGGVIRLVFLTSSGLSKFGHLAKFNNLDTPFLGGMKADTSVLDEGKTDSWQAELQKEIDVMLLVAYHNEIDLGRIVGNLVNELEEMVDDKDKNVFEVIFVQEGRAYKNKDGEGVEHFGYVDGRSQPLMLKTAIDEESKARRGGIDIYDPTAPLGQFILPDPLDSSGFGSYFVFSKLEQNVAGFKQKEQNLADTLGLKDDDKERAGAMVVGRFEDGTPLTLQSKEDGVPVINNFNYDADAAGAKCPFHAHIRKTNPRGSSPGGLKFDKSVQMARRGITYGARLQHPDTKEFIDKPNDGVGLLFMSYQASIKDQFQFMQTKWVNNANFPKDGVGIDPVIGQGGSIDQTWFSVYNSPTNPTKSLFKGFVHLKGGEYFYTPSISGLKAL